MLNKIINFSLVLSLLAFMLVSCGKDDDNNSNGPVNGSSAAVFNPDITYGTMKDADGNTYKTVTIGTQTWMAENLRTTKYNDGSPIPNVTDRDEWEYLSTGAYCNYDNSNDAAIIRTFGRLYNWHALNTGKIAPNGWRVPTDDDWDILIDYLGGPDIAGGKLKEAGTKHWRTPNTGADNETGFTALPGGQREGNGNFEVFGFDGYWWSITESGTARAWRRHLLYDMNSIRRNGTSKLSGQSVRLIKDNG
ncbi:MAG: hypothetical protein EA393_03270 [Bacteroidetes bacterium]|nr:MAG: hypothetical protein EA393_03270 [Bacteroidota bacterium]